MSWWGQEGMSRRLSAACLAGLCPLPALAETQISVFGGLNENLGSTVRLEKGSVSERSIDWEGKSFEMPPYWGVRGTYWLGTASPWGLAIELTHTKAAAKLDITTDPTYSRLEFTDGNNLLTFNVLYRFSPLLNGTLVPHAGVGAGVAIPHVEVSLKAFPAESTNEYQLAGPAAQGLIGFEYKLSDSWSLFSEAKLSYSHLNAELTGGGQLTTHLWSPQLATGLTYRFPNN